MTGGDPSGPVPQTPPPPRVSRWLNLPWIWAVPIVALAIAVWLGLHALAERGPTIHIRFATGDGIEAGRTTIRYKNVVLGQVVRLGLAPGHKAVVITAEMTREAEPLLHSNTEFWVVRPRVGLSGISGLSTLVSGAYIGMLPGKGASGARNFTGLEAPPPQQGLVQGQEYHLVADTLPSLSDDAPVYYHGVRVGEVAGQKLSDRSGKVSVRVFIYDPHQVLVHVNSRFWVSSGLQLSIGAQGVQLGTASLQTLLSGGIVFDTPKPPFAGPASPPGATFKLYPDAKAAEAAAEPQVAFRAYFPGSLRGVSVDTPVELRGLPIGRVSAIRLEYDAAADRIRVPVTIDVAPGRILAAEELIGPSPMPRKTNLAAVTDRLFERLIAKGLRARLATANFLTGSRVIELAFVPDAAPAKLVYAKPNPVLPTVAGTSVEDMTAAASGFLDKLSALPLGELIGEVRAMVRHADAVVAAPDLRHALRELDRTLVNAEKLSGTAQRRIGPLLDKLNTAAAQLNGTLALLGNDPRSSSDLARTLAQLTDAARSVRVLTDYLEQHPEALITGKPADGGRQ